MNKHNNKAHEPYKSYITVLPLAVRWQGKTAGRFVFA
jgi:hypothetical protein